jgi:hypothetical protein
VRSSRRTRSPRRGCRPAGISARPAFPTDTIRTSKD